MTTKKFEISLEGDATILLPAERAVLKIEVLDTDQNKQRASDNVVSSAKVVEELLRKLSPQSSSSESKLKAAVDHWSRTSISESSHVGYDRETQKDLPREYTAHVDFQVNFQRFGAIPGFLRDLASIDYVETEPLTWILSEETKAKNRSALRIGAAKDAHRKATEYAEALGYKKVEPFMLREGHNYATVSHMKGGRPPANSVTTNKKNMAETTAEGDASFEYQPEDVKMSASVHTSFYAM